MDNNIDNKIEQNPVISSENIYSIKLIGGLAAIFSLGVIIPYVGLLLGLASIIMFLIVFSKISKLSGKKYIFNFILISYLINIALGLSFVVFFFYSIFDFFKTYDYDIEYIFDVIMDANNIVTYAFMIFAFFYVIAIVVAFLWKRSLEGCAEFLNEKLFATAGLLYLIGAFTIILCGLGYIVSFAGSIVLAIAFFSLKSNTENNNQI